MDQRYLHCSATRVTLAVLRRKAFSHSVSLKHYATRPLEGYPLNHPKGTLESIWTDTVINTLQSLINDPFSRPHLYGNSRPLTLILPGHLTFTQRLTVPRVAPKRQENVTLYEAAQYLPRPLSQNSIATQTLYDDGVAIDTLITAAHSPLLNSLHSYLKTLGLTASAVRAAPPLHLNTFRFIYPEETKGLTLLIDIGARSSQLLLIKDARDFHLRSLSFGGETVTQTIADALKMSSDQAERVKITHTTSSLSEQKDTPPFDSIPTPKSLKPHISIVEKSLRRFLQYIDHEVTRTRLLYKDAAPVDRIFLTGGGTQLPGLTKMLQTTQQTTVKPLDPTRHLVLSPKSRCSRDSLRTPAATSALSEILGEATAPFLTDPLHLELLPRGLAAQAAATRRRPLILACAACWAATALLLLLHFRSTLQHRQQEAQKLEARIHPLQKRHNAINAAAKAAHTLATKIGHIHHLSHSHNYWVAFLDDLQDRLHQVKDAWIDTFIPLNPSSPCPSTDITTLNATPCPQRVSGHLLLRSFDPENPNILVSQDAVQQIESLITHLQASPFISTIEDLRFDTRNNRLLGFDFTLIPHAAPLL